MVNAKKYFRFLVVLMTFVVGIANAANYTWTGGDTGSPNSFTNELNWTPNTDPGGPLSNDAIFFDNSSSVACDIPDGVIIGALTINGYSGNVTALGALTVGTLTLSDGIISGGTLIVTTLVGGNPGSFVKGTLQLTIDPNGSQNFPVGGGSTGMFVTITSTDGGSYAVSTTDGAPSPVVDNSRVLQRTYSITTAAGVADISFGYPAADAPGTPTAYQASIFDGSQWDPIGGTGGATSTSITGINFGVGTSQWSAGEPDALPIQIMTLGAVAMNNDAVKLNWSTASETNNLGFYVQRKNQSVKNFATVSTLIAGAGSSLEQHDYTFSDANVGAGTYFYRIKQVDANGAFSYSKEIKIVVAGALGVADARPLSFQLNQNYPNPFNPTTNISFEIPDEGIVTLKVFNALGQEVAALINGIRYAPGMSTVSFDATAFSSGVYFYHLNVAGLSKTYQSVGRMVLAK